MSTASQVLLYIQILTLRLKGEILCYCWYTLHMSTCDMPWTVKILNAIKYSESQVSVLATQSKAGQMLSSLGFEAIPPASTAFSGQKMLQGPTTAFKLWARLDACSYMSDSRWRIRQRMRAIKGGYLTHLLNVVCFVGCQANLTYVILNHIDPRKIHFSRSMEHMVLWIQFICRK